MITTQQFRTFFADAPKSALKTLEQPMLDAMAKFQINTPLRAAAFLAQVAHETANLKSGRENLNYSSAALRAVFGKYFDEQSALKYHRKPEAIANIVYANRMGNGDTASGEGWMYRGGGAFQLTGKNNYAAFSGFIGANLVANPELIERPEYYCSSAAWFWSQNKLNELADKKEFTTITRRINGGTNGLVDRTQRYSRALKCFQ